MHKLLRRFSEKRRMKNALFSLSLIALIKQAKDMILTIELVIVVTSNKVFILT